MLHDSADCSPGPSFSSTGQMDPRSHKLQRAGITTVMAITTLSDRHVHLRRTCYAKGDLNKL